MLSKELDSDGEKYVCSSAILYVKAGRVIEMKKRLDVQEVSKRLSAMLKIPVHILYQFSTYFDKKEAVPNGKDYSSKPVKRKMASETEYI